jgi:hypothetical protein
MFRSDPNFPRNFPEGGPLAVRVSLRRPQINRTIEKKANKDAAFDLDGYLALQAFAS